MKHQNPTDGNEEKEEDAGFEELGLDPRLTRALSKKGIAKATPIQREAIPLILVCDPSISFILGCCFLPVSGKISSLEVLGIWKISWFWTMKLRFLSLFHRKGRISLPERRQVPARPLLTFFPCYRNSFQRECHQSLHRVLSFSYQQGNYVSRLLEKSFIFVFFLLYELYRWWVTLSRSIRRHYLSWSSVECRWELYNWQPACYLQIWSADYPLKKLYIFADITNTIFFALLFQSYRVLSFS